jgi:hypothetical protein
MDVPAGGLQTNKLVCGMLLCRCAAAVIQSRVREAELTELQINQARDEYRYPPAEAARLWFVVADLVALHPMYTASLTTFTAMFRHCVGAAPASATLEGRMAGLVVFLNGYVHKMVGRGLMHAHKLAFGFSMAAAGLRESGVITQQEWELFVKSEAFALKPSSSSSSSSNSRAQAAPGWCKAAHWEALQVLELALPAQLQGLCHAVAQSSSSSISTGPESSSSTASWKHLLLQGSLADFMPAHSNKNSSDKPACLLDQLLAAGDVGQQQQQQQPGAAAADVVAGPTTKSQSGQGLGLFVRLLLIKVRCCCCWSKHSSQSVSICSLPAYGENVTRIHVCSQEE